MRSVSVVTWLESEERVVEVAVAEFRRSPISPVTWANAEDNSVFSLINWSECARTTDSKAGIPGSTPTPVGCLGRPGSMRKKNK